MGSSEINVITKSPKHLLHRNNVTYVFKSFRRNFEMHGIIYVQQLYYTRENIRFNRLECVV